MGWLFLVLIIVIALILLGGFLWWGFKKALIFALNSLIGFFALYGVQAWWLHDLAINFWSIIITVILGIFGFLLVLIFHAFGWAF